MLARFESWVLNAVSECTCFAFSLLLVFCGFACSDACDFYACCCEVK